MWVREDRCSNGHPLYANYNILGKCAGIAIFVDFQCIGIIIIFFKAAFATEIGTTFRLYLTAFKFDIPV